MSQYEFKMPDLGEGTVEAEVVAWHVKPGDTVREDDVIVDVMTDKATVEVPSPVNGKVLSVSGEPGDMVAVGSALIVFETEGDSVATAVDAPAMQSAAATRAPVPPAAAASRTAAVSAQTAPAPSASVSSASAPSAPAQTAAPPAKAAGGKVLTSPAIRRQARESGIDLTEVGGSGRNGRILREDLDAFMKDRVGQGASAVACRASGADEIKIIGLRRIIAERMSAAKREIPHFAYVEEVDVTQLEALRVHLNARRKPGSGSLTYLPFLALAMVRVLREFPQCNATHDPARNMILRHHAVHLGIATQTPDGLKVPVVRHAEARALDDLTAEIMRVTAAARNNSAKREELSGSTITLTSLGKLGGIASTPVINAPEVAIVGVNKAVDRPMVIDGQVVVRKMMNLSSSFDHRFVDGFDAAAMIQRVREMLEQPATIFMAD